MIRKSGRYGYFGKDGVSLISIFIGQQKNKVQLYDF